MSGRCEICHHFAALMRVQGWQVCNRCRFQVPGEPAAYREDADYAIVAPVAPMPMQRAARPPVRGRLP